MSADPPSWAALFGWAFFASIGIEVGAALKAITSAEGTLPPLYKSPAYIVVRLLFACVAGGLGIVLATTPLTALYVGASAPIVLDRLAKGLDKPEGRGNNKPRG
jgi:hypothetical protein